MLLRQGRDRVAVVRLQGTSEIWSGRVATSGDFDWLMGVLAVHKIRNAV